jgi:hypothetical protein
VLAERLPQSLERRLCLRLPSPPNDLQPKEVEQAARHVKAEIVAVAVQKFIEGRLVDPGIFGDSIDAQTDSFCRLS